MSELIRKQLPYFRIITESKPKLSKQILNKVEKKFVLALSECCENLLRGNIKLKRSQLIKLSAQKNNIRFFADRSIKIGEKKKLIIKKQAAVIQILVPIVPVLLHHFKNEVRKENGISGCG